MQKISLVAIAAAAILAGTIGVLAATTHRTPSTAPTSVRIDTMHMMTGAKNMPTEHFADYSFVF